LVQKLQLASVITSGKQTQISGVMFCVTLIYDAPKFHIQKTQSLTLVPNAAARLIRNWCSALKWVIVKCQSPSGGGAQ